MIERSHGYRDATADLVDSDCADDDKVRFGAAQRAEGVEYRARGILAYGGIFQRRPQWVGREPGFAANTGYHNVYRTGTLAGGLKHLGDDSRVFDAAGNNSEMACDSLIRDTTLANKGTQSRLGTDNCRAGLLAVKIAGGEWSLWTRRGVSGFRYGVDIFGGLLTDGTQMAILQGERKGRRNGASRGAKISDRSLRHGPWLLAIRTHASAADFGVRLLDRHGRAAHEKSVCASHGGSQLSAR